jgi:hypothetical protein
MLVINVELLRSFTEKSFHDISPAGIARLSYVKTNIL